MAKKKTAKTRTRSTAKARTKRTTTKKSAAKAAPRYKFTKATKARTKSDIYANLAENTGVSKKDVGSVFDALSAMISQDLKKSGPQVFTLPGMTKITVVRKPATKARKGINPFTGEETVFKAKPARNVVKVRPLKALKDMA